MIVRGVGENAPYFAKDVDKFARRNNRMSISPVTALISTGKESVASEKVFFDLISLFLQCLENLRRVTGFRAMLT